MCLCVCVCVCVRVYDHWLVAVLHLQGDAIVRLSEMCRKLETEEEKVLR